MALYDSIQYLKCPKCNNVELRIEKRAYIAERKDTYVAESFLAIACAKCNETIETIDKHSPKQITEGVI